MEKLTEKQRAIDLLLSNRQSLDEYFGIKDALYTPPAPEHYPHIYLWDSCFAAIVFARLGHSREAVTELFSLTRGQRPDGMIPNMQFARDGRRWDMERFTFKDHRGSSDYSQPPVLALAAAETYRTIMTEEPDKADIFLERIYPSLKAFYGYFEQSRQNSPTDTLIGVIHPHETGRDSDPTFDFIKKLRWPRRGDQTPKWVNRYNTISDYTGVLALNLIRNAEGWDPAKNREHFWVNDVMFNCIYADNLYSMARLAKARGNETDARHFGGLASAVEKDILGKMWYPKARNGQGAFYALRPEPIETISVSNLIPLILPNLDAQQLVSILDLLDQSFDTPFPIASVATNDPNFDPHYQERGRIWRGGTWQNTNWYLEERGLAMQAQRSDLSTDLRDRCRQWTERVRSSSKELVRQGYFEFYDPLTGKGQRVKNFAWSTLADIM